MDHRPLLKTALIAALLVPIPSGARADPLPIDWYMSPLLQDCQGPCDEFGCWFDEGFDASLWEPVFLPYNEPVSSGSDRFYRGFLSVESVEGLTLSFSSDDGIEVYVNSQLIGSWGRGCHAPGCVNMQVCGIIDMVDPVDLSGYLFPGDNLLAIHVTNCECCCNMYFSAEVATGSMEPEPRAFRRGDTNQDGILDVADPLSTLSCLFLGGVCSGCADSEDSNDDGSLDLGDPLFILNHLFLGGPPPEYPGVDCGFDPSADALDCSSYPPCG